MYKIHLLTVGTLKDSWLHTGVDMYLSRLRHEWDVAIRELPASKEKDPERQRKEEAVRILQALEKMNGDIWVLDEKGKSFTSSAFAHEISERQDSGTPMIFILGGAYGLHDEVRASAKNILSLSSMTFPHDLCRIIFLEQLYRASQILRGSGYHH